MEWVVRGLFLAAGVAAGVVLTQENREGIPNTDECSLMIITSPNDQQDFSSYQAVLLHKDGRKVTIPAGPAVSELFMTGGMAGQKK